MTTLSSNNQTVQDMLQQLQSFPEKRSKPIFITHIRAHSGLPGPMTLGNETADLSTMPRFKLPTEEPGALHTNIHHLHINYHIT